MADFDNRAFRHQLLSWYKDHHRKLPWRQTRDPYRIWVSEIMLQQTQVATVIDYYIRFIERFPDLPSLASADLQEVLKLWEGLGYYSRARNLYLAACQLSERNPASVPDTLEAFKELPGVGDYTAAAVQSIAFDAPAAVVDGNVKRVLARLFEIDIPVNDSSVHTVFRNCAAELLDTGNPGLFNQAMMELGALVCRPAAPDCGQCPVAGFCRAASRGTTGDFPKRRPSRKTPLRRQAAAAVIHDGRLLIHQRDPDGFLGGMWEFPCVTLPARARPASHITRHLAETTGIDVGNGQVVTRVKHAYSHFRLDLTLFLFLAQGPGFTEKHQERYRWITWPEIQDFPFHKAVHKCFPALEARLAGHAGRQA